MPISTSSFGDERDKRYEEYTSADDYEEEVLDFLGLSPEQAETILKRLGGPMTGPGCPRSPAARSCGRSIPAPRGLRPPF